MNGWSNSKRPRSTGRKISSWRTSCRYTSSITKKSSLAVKKFLLSLALGSPFQDSENMKYKRILLKLSGEALMGDQQYGIDINRVAQYAKDIKEIHSKGMERSEERRVGKERRTRW